MIALVLLVLLAPVSFYVEQLIKVSWGFSEMVPPIAALGLLFLLAAINQRRRPEARPEGSARRGRALSRAELLTIYVILTIGAPLVSRGVMLWFLSCSLGQRYYAETAPMWEAAFFQYLPAWSYPGDWTAIEGFFQGDAAVPWISWGTPLAAWGSFFFVFYLANLSLLTLFRRQWIAHERLSFPIAQVPLETVREGPDGTARLPRASMFWIGLGAAVVLNIQYRLPAIFPTLPSISLGEYVLLPAEKVGPFAGVGDIWLILYPWCIALAFLIPKELSFSVWFFWLVRVICTVLAIVWGATPRRPESWGDATFPAPYYQGGGAVIALALLTFWSGRRQVARIFRQALRWWPRPEASSRGSSARAGAPPEGSGPPQQEGVSDRWVMLVLFLSLAYLVLFCQRLGARTPVALGLLALIISYHLVWARLRAENGMSFIGFPLSANDMLLTSLGTNVFRPGDIVTIVATRWSYYPGWGESCEVITGSSADALKLSDSARISQRRLLLAMAGCFLFALGLGVCVELAAVYHYGFYQILPHEGWLENSVRAAGVEIYDAITNPTRVNSSSIIGLSVGMVVAFLLGELRLRFWWWPFHPVGYLAANVWGSQWWWEPLFLGWLFKTLVIRYGGLRLYQRAVPLAIGVIVGDRVSEILWALILWPLRAQG